MQSNLKEPKQKRNGRKLFPPKNIMYLEKREQNPHSQESYLKTRKQALTYALPAETSYTVQKQNLIRAQAGPVSGKPFLKIVLQKIRITASE